VLADVEAIVGGVDDVWYFGVLPLFRPCTLRRAYADLPTVLTIVHFDGTHPIPPQYV
jgi:hypothetical protein